MASSAAVVVEQLEDQAALQAEARIVPLLEEKKRLFNELLTSKRKHKGILLCKTPF
ncbi:hypothetical protein HPP92_005634 [Vanilla planifolia]|uniref:Uncharacterized protein n=1 Tax=Vanilla planifolia TaxID=51239 RepID=A0A835RUF5_VANPL|nr:hypothetical protein HPP92_005634 [Vanilla planifolia]